MAFTHLPEAFRDIAQIGAEMMRHHFGLIEQRLASQPYIAGQDYSMLDALAVYQFAESREAGVNTADFPRFTALAAQVMSRPAVQAALAREGAAMGQLMAEGPPPAPMPKFL
jgi:glutathione S-transferase